MTEVSSGSSVGSSTQTCPLVYVSRVEGHKRDEPTHRLQSLQTHGPGGRRDPSWTARRRPSYKPLRCIELAYLMSGIAWWV